ncbi:MAG: hypothetical protein L0Y75_09250 [Acidobacteria bacterium]|nr:hypothetical protein [Acidobacteriota bacterium]
MAVLLTPEIENALASQAQRQGMAPDQLAQQILPDKLREMEREETGGLEAALGEAEGTLADLFAGRTGVISGSEMSARNTGKRFTEILC